MCPNLLVVADNRVHPLSSPIRVKGGYREMSSSMTFGVVSKSDPVWMWSLRPNSWKKIFVLATDVTHVRSKHPELFAITVNILVPISSTFAGDYSTIFPDVMFVSGSRRFIMSLVLPLSWHTCVRVVRLVTKTSHRHAQHSMVSGVALQSGRRYQSTGELWNFCLIFSDFPRS